MITGTKQWKKTQKKKVIGMLRGLIKKIESDELLVLNHGFWVSNLDQKIFFKVETISHDSSQVSSDFRDFS